MRAMTNKRPQLRPMLTVKDVANTLRVHPHTVLDLHRVGHLPPATRLRRKLLWTEEQILEFIVENRGRELDLSVGVRELRTRGKV